MAKEVLAKVKVAEIANELTIKSKDVIAKAGEIGITIKSVNSSVDEKQAQLIYDYIAMGKIPDELLNEKPKKTRPKKEVKTDTKTTKDSSSFKKSTKVKLTESGEAKKESVKEDINFSKDTNAKINNIEQKQTNKDDIIDVSNQTDKQINDNKSEDIIISKPTRKIIIVSKNNEQDNTSSVESKPSKTSEIMSLGDMQDSLNAIKNSKADTSYKKKNKDVKKPHTAKHVNEKRVDMNRELGDTNIDDDKDEVMLIDLSEVESKNDYEKKDRIEDRIRIQRSNPWFFDSIKRDGKKKKKKWQGESSSQSQVSNKVHSVVIPDEIRVYEFADKIGVKVTDIISKLFKMGEMVTKNDFLDSTTIEILSQEFNVSVELSSSTQELEYIKNDSYEEKLVERAPVVTIMGHVDHGKTSLLDYIRNSSISKSEHGGITQHIGAYMVEKNGKSIAFIDTPGHEAFANMRSRGAQVTDIAIIVIAADDGVKQQTKEALSHAKDSNVQIIVAMNKIDKEGANVDKLKAEMAEIGYSPSDWGGEYDFIPLSAKTGEGVDTLLDTILLQAEIMELKANIAGAPKAVILEGSLDKGKGPVVTVMVQSGILRVGDSVVADTAYGKVRALMRDNGHKADAIYPSQVAQLSGLSEVPSAGVVLAGVENDSVAKEYAQKRKSYLRAKELSKSTKVSFDELSSVVAEGRLKPLRLILKADTQGSLEALKSSLEVLSNDEIKVNIISSSVGSINENDINTAQSTKDCYILGFNVKPLGILKTKAKELNVSIKSHSVIYNIIDEVKELIASMMSPIIEEELIGSAEVRDIFSIGKGNVIAGCFVTDGIISKTSKVRLLRGSKELYFGNLISLKRFKDDVREVSKGYECGIMLDNFNDIIAGDVFEVIKEVAKQKKYE